MNKNLLWIGGDNPLYQYLIRELHLRGYRVATCSAGSGADRELAIHPPDLILLDHPWPDGEISREMIECWARDYPMLVLCEERHLETALDALRLGAMEFLVKPIIFEELASTLQRMIEHAARYRQGEFYTNVVRREPPTLLVGNSVPLRRLLSIVQAVAPTEATVLILGESGVGKEKVAQEIHRLSHRADQPLVWVDCCSLQESLFESELFGHERGAFTGAVQRKIGLIEQAHGGTLFLDEIGEISLKIQAKLLRVLESRQFRRLGGTTDLEAEVRILTATNRRLDEMAQRGEFREDLLYRLNTFVIEVPPLRERHDDIPLLVQHFLAHPARARRIVKRPSESALQQLMKYPWPGNVRELRNIIERAVILSRDALKIEPEHLTLPGADMPPPPATGVAFAFDHEPTLAELEQYYVQLMVDRHQGCRATLAKILGISERTLYRMLGNLHLR